MTNFDFFLVYYRHMIDSGVRQIDIHKSGKVTASVAYINKIYKNPPKSCSIELQTEIARYFGLTYEQMIEEGKKTLSRTPGKLNQHHR